MLEQHIPIFVGSTYLDLKDYRVKVRETLTRMETFVHGMEHFGALPGRPVDECLAKVRECKIYVGIFAMRYGSIPDGYDKSMIEIEYEEAQRLGLPSYIFIIDEKEATIHPKDIDFENQGKLRTLKKRLMQNHTPDYFISPEDLANKVGSAIHGALKENKSWQVNVRTGIESIIKNQTDLPPMEIIDYFKLLPRRWNGISFHARYEYGNLLHGFLPQQLSYAECTHFDLPTGDSIKIGLHLLGTKGYSDDYDLPIVASGDDAERLINMPHCILELIVETYFREPTESFDLNISSVLKLKEIVSVEMIERTHEKQSTTEEDIPF